MDTHDIIVILQFSLGVKASGEFKQISAVNSTETSNDLIWGMKRAKALGIELQQRKEKVCDKIILY